MATSSYIYCNRQDDIYEQGGFSNSFLISIPPSDAINFDQVRISIDSICFNNLAYPINGDNNTLLISTANNNAVVHTATVPEGNYNEATFITALLSALQTATGSAGFTATVNPANARVTLTNNVVVFRLRGGSMLTSILGYEGAGSLFANSAVASYPINLAGTNWVDVTLNIQSMNTKSGRQLPSDIYCRVPLDRAFGSLISWTNMTPSSIPIDHNFQELRVELFDDQGQAYRLPYNSSFSVVLRLDSEIFN
jgi:hypothetical protein